MHHYAETEKKTIKFINIKYTFIHILTSLFTATDACFANATQKNKTNMHTCNQCLENYLGPMLLKKCLRNIHENEMLLLMKYVQILQLANVQSYISSTVNVLVLSYTISKVDKMCLVDTTKLKAVQFIFLNNCNVHVCAQRIFFKSVIVTVFKNTVHNFQTVLIQFLI